ncbi:MAG: UvrABC system protein B [candidate division TM6 bacterium GW2011_GWE2_42_60]|nr:MAG: UvrABC system protein B [candidate division TM6 bacterium GW2011_GWE2_42_60]HBY05372.1 excinuclease ABC subunit B [Candidatus Dependentiae bacterium]
MALFKLHAPFPPAGDQVKAIDTLVKARPGRSTLLGVTGSGKTYTIAQVIAQQSKPVLILSPNKTLAAQLYEEFSLFFPENKVCYFVSYYDYYQPESYLPAQDIYIPKETRINSEIERLRVESTASIINRPDTIVVASVSCIYSLGNPTDYRNLAFSLKKGQQISRADLLRQLIFIQYTRNDMERSAGTFQVSGPTVEVQLPYQKEKLRIELEGNEIEGLYWVHKQTNEVLLALDNVLIFPAKHFVTTQERKDAALKSIKAELDAYVPTVQNPLYRERIKTRIEHDLELIEEIGYCSGIENYSVHFDGRASGEPPFCLFDFFEDFLLVIDESHIAIPQLRGMYAGDAARKKSLIDFGFRLPSSYDNRPLKFAEIEKHFKDVIFVSATPSPYELESSSVVAEQIIRPTGLIDPPIELHKREGQLAHLIEEIRKASAQNFRTLVTVLTKKQAEELARYLQEQHLKVCYLHHDLKTPQRTELLHKLRNGVFECLVGVNLLREGLDLPEVALVAIMDADIESFLRDKRSLIQTIGRAARNTASKVIFYGDSITESMQAAIDETNRRRTLQIAYNTEHGITPRSVSRDVTKSISKMQEAIAAAQKGRKKQKDSASTETAEAALHALITRISGLEEQMQATANAFDFEKAIELRKEWRELQTQLAETTRPINK